jgi:hypothetical protein
LYFEATPKTLDEVTRVLGITDMVLRFMPIKHDKPFSLMAPAAAPAASVPAVAPVVPDAPAPEMVTEEA